MFKKILALAAAAALALTLAACGGTGEQLPTLVLEDPSASNTASDVSGVESGAQPLWKRCLTRSSPTP